ncbi:MAG TPA: hypothetical protein DIU15_10385, partial [Deltaproteobacteria bacterium]|nr:hypothetical protein [Deltaproteobacteria bacterium]
MSIVCYATEKVIAMTSDRLQRISPILIALLLAVPSTAAAQATGGPNTFGYSWDEIPVDFVPRDPVLLGLGVGVGSNPMGMDDDGEETVQLPWAFEYYGNSYTEIIVGSNGGIKFSGSNITFVNGCLPVT